MSTDLSCPACGSRDVVAQLYSAVVEFKGIPVDAVGLQQSHCMNCGYEFASDEQHDNNVDLVRAAFVEQRAAAKREMGRLTGQEIRAIRIGLGLSQLEAAELFGGGVNAFSRYEKEEVVQPASMDRLIRLAAYLGVDGLAAIRASREVRCVKSHDDVRYVSVSAVQVAFDEKMYLIEAKERTAGHYTIVTTGDFWQAERDFPLADISTNPRQVAHA